MLDSKFPSEIITTRYAPVQNATIEYFTSSIKDVEVFKRVQDILGQKPTDNDHQKEKIKSCIEALNHLTNCAEDKLVPYAQNPAIKGYKDCKSITVNGVLISLRPEILLLNPVDNQPKGAIKLVFGKNHFLTIQEGQCIAGLIRSYLENELKIKINYKNCFTLDVFSRRIIYSPIKNDWTESKIQNACNNIKNIWPTLHKN